MDPNQIPNPARPPHKWASTRCSCMMHVDHPGDARTFATSKQTSGGPLASPWHPHPTVRKCHLGRYTWLDKCNTRCYNVPMNEPTTYAHHWSQFDRPLLQNYVYTLWLPWLSDVAAMVRAEPELSTRKLAKVIGCSHMTVARWLNGQVAPGLLEMLALAVALDIDLPTR